MQTLLVLYLVFGLFLTLISLPLIGEKVKPNPLYGFRVPSTLNNSQIWYAVNKHAGKRLLATGIVFTIAAIGLYFVPEISLDAYALSCMAFFMVVFAIGMIQSVLYLRTLKQEDSHHEPAR